MSTLANYGYVVVQVARRGNGPSFGQRRAYNDRTEAYDAYEVIDWLAAQPWSTGDVGIYGCSNTGDAAMHAITADNPHLKAAWAGCFSWEKYDGFLRGGILANWGTGPDAHGRGGHDQHARAGRREQGPAAAGGRGTPGQHPACSRCGRACPIATTPRSSCRAGSGSKAAPAATSRRSIAQA